MKRIMYVSTATAPMSGNEVEEIGRVSSRNNLKVGITGVLFSAHEFFFQILEGDAHQVDRLLERIRRDRRHRDVLVLKAELDVTERLFSKWSMRMIRLDSSSDFILQALRTMLENITESYRIIERYTQPSVLKLLTEGVNPLGVPVHKAEQIVLFGDIVAFSYLSERFPIEEVADLVSQFLEVCSRRVVENGGEVTKYVGDCVMAHFNGDNADGALEACLGTLSDIKNMREGADSCRLMRFLYSGFGLTKGSVIEGNIGSSIKLDYTVLGDTVNLAARLEGLTRNIGRAIALTRAVCDACTQTWQFVPVGDFHLKGQSQSCPVYSLADEIVGEMRTHDQLVDDMLLLGQACRFGPVSQSM
ncbi:BLUF domain-containing protein [Methyloterricola oryzae]|uniref:BLUF domain-containing protein n=1 Tax=Methyloterricola oryzae TaxID=1495050 RepID=UPI0009E60FA0|nr:BLUF domain-containing protein [Methyloterricola oryzae]